MSKWALVIGSQTGDLEGVDRDARRIADALSARGFSVDLRTGPAATRAGILAGYRALIDRARTTGPDTTAAIYYAGHGSYVAAREPDPAGGLVGMQVILPFDVAEWTDDDFRGVSTWELSLLQAELTAITHNVTVILDCCHAAQMSRDAGPPSRMRGCAVTPRRLASHLAELRARGARFDTLDPAGNPHAVRLVAAGQHESARERPTAVGWSGAMTDAFLSILEQIGDTDVPWTAIGRAVRERVQAEFSDQRPEVEGPVRRALFSLDELPETRAFAVHQAGGKTRLRAGRLAGVVEDDVYGLAPALAPAHTKASSLGTARVTKVTSLEAELAIEPGPAGAGALPPDAIAFPLSVALPRFPVALEVGGDLGATIAARIAAAPRLRLATGEEPPLVSIRRAGTGLVVEDAIGPLSEPTAAADPDAVAGVVAIAGTMAAGRSVLGLASDSASVQPAAVEWGVVVDGKPVARPPHGSELALSDAIYVKIENHSQVPVFAHVFNVGLRGRVALLTRLAPGGLRVAAGSSAVLGSQAGTLAGLKLSWPKGVPATTRRRDDLVILVTLNEVDLRMLETDVAATRSAGMRGGSQLQRLLSQLHVGGTRNIEAPEADTESVQVIHRSFLLAPPGSPPARSAPPA